MSNRIIIYIHGKGGNSKEADFYKKLFCDDVVGLEYDEYLPWLAKDNIKIEYDNIVKDYDNVVLIANSIGAYFSFLALNNEPKIEETFLISPMVDMEKLIMNMITWANTTERELQEKKEIKTSFGETLSWEYLTFVRNNKVIWKYRTHIIYGEKDHLVDFDTINMFANSINADLTIMKDGEHWFHTEPEMKFLSEWIKEKYVRN